MKLIDVLIKYLKAEGVDTVFGVPGGLLHPFFYSIEKNEDIDLVVAKHETGAVFMCDGWSRVTNKIGVCAGTSGPGSTNLLTGVAVAYSDCVPMLVITGQAPSANMGSGAAQETTPEDINIVEMFKPVTKYSAMISNPNRGAHHIRRALRNALSGRQGPVHLNVPVDLWAREVDENWFDPKTYRPQTSYFDREAVIKASEALFNASYPVLFVGAGVGSSRAQEHLYSLAKFLPAKVATTPRAKGLFPEDHALSMGVFGFASHKLARETLLGDQVDVLFGIGASFDETSTMNWDQKLRPKDKLIQNDIKVEIIGRNYPVDIPLIGDAQTILIEILHHIHRFMREGRRPRSKWNPDEIIDSNIRYDEIDKRTADVSPLTPQRWRAELSEALPQEAIVFSDIGGHMLFNIHHLQIKEGQQFIINLGFGSMGHGTAAPVGASIGLKKKLPVFAIIGDACFTMQGMELLAAVEYDVPAIWIVEQNQCHGIIWHGSKQVSGHPMDSIRYKKKLSISKIAEAMGLKAFTVDKPNMIAEAIGLAMQHNGPSLIEVIVDPDIAPPLGERAKTVGGFKDKQ
jgi:acetolactate synthase-1/2/3 large subunit